MLHRTTKENDQSKDKWLGIGGKFEDGESPEECMLREVKEETNLAPTKYDFRGIVTFVSDQWETEYMHLFTVEAFEGVIASCDEGELEWVEIDKVYDLNLWEGDRIFLRRLQEGKKFFLLKLQYEGEKLVDNKMWEREI